MKMLREKILNDPRQSFSVFEEKGELLHCRFHTHPEFELTQVVSGHGSIFINSDIAPFFPGSLCLFGPQIPHNYINLPPDAHVRGIQFRADFAGEEFLNLPEFGMLRKMLNESGAGLVFSPETGESAVPLLEDAMNPHQVPAKRFLAFLELLILISESRWNHLSRCVSIPFASDADPRILKAISLIQKNVGENKDFTLTAIARSIGLGSEVFSRYFKRITGARFMDYVLRLRIGKASEKLQNTRESISKIAFDCGFRNLSNFNRHFARIKNMTPKAFRKRCLDQ